MDYHSLSLSQFPAEFHRIVVAWYEWQGLYLWSRGCSPGETRRDPAKWESTDQVDWGAQPPVLLPDGVLAFDNASGDLRYSVVAESGAYYLDVEERGSRERYWMFRRYEDLEKYLLLAISQDARPGNYAESPKARWRAQGPDPKVILAQPDPEEFPGRLSITVIGESAERCWMGRSDAIAFSHAIFVSYEELNKLVREGIPAQGFQAAVSGN